MKAARNAYRHRSSESFLKYLVTQARARACRRGLSFAITWEDARRMLRAQGGVCPLTGLRMTWLKGGAPSNISIDRIDSGRGYEPDNVRLVCHAANVARNALSDNEFYGLCLAVVEMRTKGCAPFDMLGDEAMDF